MSFLPRFFPLDPRDEYPSASGARAATTPKPLKAKPVPEIADDKSLGKPSKVISLVLPMGAAKALIREMTEHVVNPLPYSEQLEFPRHEESRRIVRFKPRVIRTDLERQTVSCFGWSLGDEGCLLYRVTFPSFTMSGEPVPFEISDWFNPPTPVPVSLEF